MGLVECLDKSTGKTWAGLYAEGPNMGVVEEDLDGVREIFKIASENTVPIQASQGQISQLKEKLGYTVDPNECRPVTGKQLVAIGAIKTRKRSEEHTSELQKLMRNSYAVFCL